MTMLYHPQSTLSTSTTRATTTSEDTVRTLPGTQPGLTVSRTSCGLMVNQWTGPLLTGRPVIPVMVHNRRTPLPSRATTAGI